MTTVALFTDRFELCRLLGDDVVGRTIALTAGSCRNQLTDDDVFLQTDQMVDLALDRGIGQHLGRLLEGSRRQEGIGLGSSTVKNT